MQAYHQVVSSTTYVGAFTQACQRRLRVLRVQETYEIHYSSWHCIIFRLFVPSFHGQKTFSTGYIVDENNAMCTSIVAVGKSSKPLLSGGIKKIQSICFAADGKFFNLHYHQQKRLVRRRANHLEIHAYGSCGGLGVELVFAISYQYLKRTSVQNDGHHPVTYEPICQLQTVQPLRS